MNDQKTVVVPDKPRYRVLHIEAPGCIVNLYPVLQTDSGHRVTSVEIVADDYADGDRWHMPDIQDAPKTVRIRVVKRKNDAGESYKPEEDPTPDLFAILRMGGSVSLPFDVGGIRVSFMPNDDGKYFHIRYPDGSETVHHLRESLVREKWNELRRFDGKQPYEYWGELMDKYIRLAWTDPHNDQVVEEIQQGVLVVTVTLRKGEQTSKLRWLNRNVIPICEALKRDGIQDSEVARDWFAGIPAYIGK